MSQARRRSGILWRNLDSEYSEEIFYELLTWCLVSAVRSTDTQ